MKIFICQFCGSERKNHNSWRNHERCCPSNPNRNYKNGMTGKKGSNQFIKAKEFGLDLPRGNGKKHGVPHTEETKQKLSKIAIKRGLGGVRQSRWITYKGKTLGSSYELEVAKSLDENGIEWDTCKRFGYSDPNGKKRTYTPDIYLPEFDVYLDPKNDFLINNINPSLGFSDKDKINLVEKQNKIKILILNKYQLEWNIIKELL